MCSSYFFSSRRCTIAPPSRRPSNIIHPLHYWQQTIAEIFYHVLKNFRVSSRALTSRQQFTLLEMASVSNYASLKIWFISLVYGEWFHSHSCSLRWFVRCKIESMIYVIMKDMEKTWKCSQGDLGQLNKYRYSCWLWRYRTLVVFVHPITRVVEGHPREGCRIERGEPSILPTFQIVREASLDLNLDTRNHL